MQGEFPEWIDDGVARVSAALIADNIIEPFRQQIDHAALALVPPVDPNNSAI
jgi:hypothetical protein